MLRTQAVFVLQETNKAFVFAHGDFLTSLDKRSISRHLVLVENFQFCTFRGQCADTDTMTHSTVPIKPTDDRFLWHHWQMEEQLLFELLFTKKNSLLNLIFWDMSYCGIAHFVSLGGLQTPPTPPPHSLGQNPNFNRKSFLNSPLTPSKYPGSK